MNPHYGTWHNIRTPKGVARIRARIATDRLQGLSDAFAETGDYRKAAREAGVSRRMAHTYLTKMGLLVSDPRKQTVTTEYTFGPTEKSVRTVYPWGTIHRAACLYWDRELTTRQVAQMTGVPEYTVWNWISGLGMARSRALQTRIGLARRAGFDTLEMFQAEVSRLYSEGSTVEHIASVLGVSRNSVSSVLKRKKRRTRKPQESGKRREYTGFTYPSGMGNRPAREARKARILELAESGAKPMEIASLIGVSVSTVYLDIQKSA